MTPRFREQAARRVRAFIEDRLEESQTGRHRHEETVYVRARARGGE